MDAGDNGVVFYVMQVVTVLLASLSMSMALAHALEFPGKMRLDKDAYLATQSIYYPGFTFGGAAEPLSIFATFVLLWLTRSSPSTFCCTLIAFLALLIMHAIFWTITQPVNRFWLKNQPLNRLGRKFFSAKPVSQQPEQSEANGENWESMRDRWEYSHLVRAGLSVVALIALTIALALGPRTGQLS